MDYFGAKNRKQLPLALIKGAFASVADTAIVQLQDWIELDNSARMNTPSTIGKNWMWRIQPSLLTPELIEKMKSITELYGRAKLKKRFVIFKEKPE